MTNLYNNKLAVIYDNMYQSFIDYEEEFIFYSTYCKKYKANSVIELACGSGNLAKNFSISFEDYLGVDLSEDMLKLAKEKIHSSLFCIGDMRSFQSSKKFDAALITGRSTSYLTTEEDFLSALRNIRSMLNKKGVLIFDCIDSEKFIPYVKRHPKVIHEALVDNTLFFRETYWKASTPISRKMIEWDSKYYKFNKRKNELIGEDKTVFKVFSRSEVKRFLNESGYNLIEVLDRKTYAFETFVVIAKKPSLKPSKK